MSGMNRKAIKIAVVVLCASVSCIAQETDTNPFRKFLATVAATTGTFNLGMTANDAASKLGKPPNGFYHYLRKTTSNEYDLRLDFGKDDSESRLHPVYRLTGVKILIDRPAAAKAILEDIPEARALCAKGCAVLAITHDSSFGFNPRIVIYPTDPTPEQMRVGNLIGTGWRPELASKTWLPAITLPLNASSDGKIENPDWMNQKIETLTFTTVCPAVEEVRGIQTRPSSSLPSHPPVKLAPWPPSL